MSQVQVLTDAILGDGIHVHREDVFTRSYHQNTMRLTGVHLHFRDAPSAMWLTTTTAGLTEQLGPELQESSRTACSDPTHGAADQTSRQGHLNEDNANELLRKLYRIGKGQQAAVILGEYSGNESARFNAYAGIMVQSAASYLGQFWAPGMGGPIHRFPGEYGHDYWLVGSVGLLMVLQVLRAVAAQWSPKYAVHGKRAALWYLATDFSAMGDNVAIVLSLWSLAYCKAVHWNWMIFSFVRVIEILGRWEIGVNFYGLPNEGSDRSMIYALVVFGAVIWILIGSLFHVVNAANDASKWDFAQVRQGEKSEPWQRFESIPSSMFYALLNLNKKNPLAYVYQDWYEKLLVIFVNVFCVPLFSLVSSMIGTTITAMILSKDPDADEQAGKEEEEEGDEEEEEEEEDEEVEDEEVEPPEEPAVPLRQQLAEFWKSLTWEDHLHPAAMAVLGFGSLFFYGICSAQRPMRWLFFEVEKVPPWANPCVDGTVGILFLLDWKLRGLAPPKPGPEAEEADGLLSESSKTASGFSPWRGTWPTFSPRCRALSTWCSLWPTATRTAAASAAWATASTDASAASGGSTCWSAGWSTPFGRPWRPCTPGGSSWSPQAQCPSSFGTLALTCCTSLSSTTPTPRSGSSTAPWPGPFGPAPSTSTGSGSSVTSAGLGRRWAASSSSSA
ncbi:unnamed protein product [Effrenium voratum]|nr:unnamed protein product [Effrenium voratum]